MDDKWALPRIILLALLLVAIVFVGTQIDRAQQELIGVQQQLKGQGEILRDLAVDQKRLLERGVSAPARSGKPAMQSDPSDGIIRADGRNCLIDSNSLEPADPAAKDGGTLNLLWRLEFNDFNPLLENSADLTEITKLVLLPLYDRAYMQDGRKFYTGVARSLRVSDDFKTYILELNDNIYWHMPAVNLNDDKFSWIRDLGPQKVTAHDYVFSVMDIIMNPDSQCDVHRVTLEQLAGVEALDDFTLKVTWKEKFHPSLTATQFGTIVPKFLYSRYEDGNPIPAAALGEEFNRHWYNNRLIGCGPYRFVECVKGGRIVLERDENYPLRERGHFDRIVYHYVAEPEAQLQKFKNGELDFLELDAGVYEAEIKRIENDPEARKKSPFYNGQLTCKKVETPGYSYIGWNQNREAFSDPRVRRAMTLALPVRKLLEDVWVGLGEELTGPIHKFSQDYDRSLPVIPFDLEAASKLLEQAGWTDTDGDGIREKKLKDGSVRPLEVEVIHYSPMSAYDQMFAVYSHELLKIGVRLKALGLDWPTLIKRVEERNFDGVAMGWALTYDTDPYQIWHSSQADNPKGSNRIGYANPEVDAIVEKARRTFEPDERRKLFHRFHKIMYDEQPYTLWRARMTPFAWNAAKLKEIRFDTRRPEINELEWWDHSR